MSDTYTTPFVFHDAPTNIHSIETYVDNLLNLAEYFNFTSDWSNLNVTDTGAIVFDLTFKSPTDLDLFTRHYNGELGLY